MDVYEGRYGLEDTRHADFVRASHNNHITRDIKNTKTALQVLPASLRGTFLAQFGLK